MATLEHFLGEIGAGSLSSVIEWPPKDAAADQQSHGPADQIYQRIQREVQHNDDKTLALLKDRWDDFAQQLKLGDQLVRQLKDEEDELASLENEMDGPDSWLPGLVSHLEEQQALAAAHLLTTTSVALLSALLAFNTTVAALSDATGSGDLVAAVQAQRAVTRAVEVGADEWIEDTDVWKSLIRWAAEEESRLEAALQGAVESCFQVQPASTENGRVARLTLCERVAAAPNGPEIPVEALLRGLEDLAVITGRKDQSDAILVRVAKQLLRHFIAPFLEANGPPRSAAGASKPRLDFVVSLDPSRAGEHSISLQAAEGEGAEAIEGLSVFLDFVTKRSSLFPTSPSDNTSKHAAIFTAHLTPSLQSHVISSHLTPSLPVSIESLDEYMATLAAANAFESEFLAAHHLFAFLPPSLRREGREVEEQRVIRSWATRVPHHWARHVGDAALARVRTAVKSWDWGAGEMVEVEVKEEEEMLGLLLGLGLVDPEDEAAVSAAAAGDPSQLDLRNHHDTSSSMQQQYGPSFDGKRRLPRELALQTVPKSAKREMTVEEALRPKIRRTRTPSPPRRPDVVVAPSAVPENPVRDEPETVEQGEAPASSAPQGTLKRGKLGAARIPPLETPPSLSPASPPPPPPPSPPNQSDEASMLPAEATSNPVVVEDVLSVADETGSLALAEEPIAPPPPSEDPIAPIKPQDVDPDEIIVPQPVEDEVFAPFEAPATTAAGIETTADTAPEEDVVRPHEYRAEVDDEIGAEVENQREATPPLTEATLDAAHAEAAEEMQNPTPEAVPASNSSHHEEQSYTPEDDLHVKEESVEPVLPPVSLADASSSPTLGHEADLEGGEPYEQPEDEVQATSWAPSEREGENPDAAEPNPEQAWQPVPIEMTDFDDYDDLGGAEDAGPSYYDRDAPQPAVEEDASLLFAESADSVTELAAVSSIEAVYEESAAPTDLQGASSAPGPVSETEQHAYVPFDDDPYADDSFADLAQEDYPAPTRDDFFSPPSQDESAYVEVPSPPAQQSDDPYAPPRREDSRDQQMSPAAAQIPPPPPPPIQPAHQSSSRYAPLPQASTAVPPPPPPTSSVPSSVPPPPPRASNAYAPAAARSKPPKRRIVGLDESGNAEASRVGVPPIPPQPTAEQPHQPIAREAPRAVIAPLRSAFTNLSRPTRSGTPPRQDGPIQNHIQQRFVSPPPSMLNPYVPMALPPTAPSGSSYLPANDPLLADLLGGASSKAKSTTANYFSPDRYGSLARADPSPAPQAANFANATAAQQAPYGAYSAAQSPYGYAAPPQGGQQYGFPQYGAPPPQMQPVMRMRGGFSSDTVPEDAIVGDVDTLRLRGGADLGDMDDDGNHSADDWGFGSDPIASGDVEEDAWGFDDDEASTPAPTPAPASSSTKSGATPASPPAKAAPSADRELRRYASPERVHSSSLSKASNVSAATPSIIRSRPASLVYSPSLAPPPRRSLDLPVAEAAPTEDENEEFGDDAWGFDENDAAGEEVADPNEAEAAANDELRQSEERHELDAAQRTGDDVGVTALESAGEGEHEVPDMTATSDALPDTDDWGFGVDEDAAPDHSEAIAAAPSAEVVDLLDSSSTSEDAATSEPLPASPSQAFASSVHGDQASPDKSLLVDGSQPPTEKLPTQSPKVLAAPEPEVDESRSASEEQAGDAWDLDPVESEELLAPVPEEDQARSPDETAAAAVPPVPVPPTEADREDAFSPAEDVPAPPSEEPAEDGQREVSTDAAGTMAHEAAREEEFDPEPAESDDLSGVAPPKPASLSSEAGDDTVREPVAELSALNAPAEQLHDDFPDDATPPPVDTPLIAQPLPHSDDFQPGTITGSQDAHLAAQASAQLADASMLVEDDQSAEDPWSIDDNEIGEGAESTGAPPEGDLTALDSFAGDRTEAERLENDLPLEESFLDPQPAHLEPSLPHDFDDFADFDSSERVQQAPQPAWEPFEEPSGQPESTPTSADGYDRRAEHDRDGFSAEPSDIPEVLRRSSIEEVEFVAASSRPDAAETEASPSTSGEGSGVMVREAEMSSPEMVGGNGEWEGQAGPAGAEILDLEEGSLEGAQHGERDSVVQHEELRPTPHDESAVQHESERLIVADEVIQPGVVLPAQDVHPQQRTFTPPLNALPQGDDGAEWDFDDDENAGAEVLAEPAFEAEHAPSSIPDESTVQHIVDRSTTNSSGPALPASTAQPQDHTFSLPMSAVPDPSGPIAAESPTLGDTEQAALSPSQSASTLPQHDDAAEWTFEDDDANAGAEMLAEPAFEAELAPSSIPDESTVQHIAERSTFDGAGPALPTSTAQPQEHTFSPPITSLPDPSTSMVAETSASGETVREPSSPSHSGQHALASSTSTHHDDAAEWDFDDNDANAGAEMLEEPACEAELAPPPIPDESAVQHAIDRPIVEEPESAQEPMPASLVQPQEHTFSPPTTAVPATSAQPELSGATRAPALTETNDRRLSPSRILKVDSAPTSGESQVTDGLTPRATLEHPSGGVESAGLTAERGEADLDDPWDLDPLEPEATVADFAAEIVTPLVATPVAVARAEEPALTKQEPSMRNSSDAHADGPQASAQSSPPAIVNRESEEAGPSVRAPVPPEIDYPAESPRSAASEPAQAGADSELGGDGGDETWEWNDDDAEAPSAVPHVASPPAPTPTRPAEASSISATQDSSPVKEAAPSAPTVRRETMMVSRQSREIIEIAEQVLLEAFEVSSPSFRLPHFSAASEPLLRTFVSILSLYRATASVHNSNLLASVPAIAMQFANDAEWIGREADRVWHSIATYKAAKVPKSQVREIELAIQSTRQLGRDTRQKQISIQQAALMESLDEAGGFLGTSNENRYAACERALQQVIHTLQRLALVWKPIMTSTALYTTLGGLVNEVLLRVLDEIEEQTDISEEESIRLNKLSKMLHDLEGLFDGSETNVGREVPIWYKFSFLSELLEASMADFMFLFDNRFLLDFTPQELVRLLRALIADSPQRDAAVKRVLQGHPDAPADEDESS